MTKSNKQIARDGKGAPVDEDAFVLHIPSPRVRERFVLGVLVQRFVMQETLYESVRISRREDPKQSDLAVLARQGLVGQNRWRRR